MWHCTSPILQQIILSTKAWSASSFSTQFSISSSSSTVGCRWRMSCQCWFHSLLSEKTGMMILWCLSCDQMIVSTPPSCLKICHRRAWCSKDQSRTHLWEIGPLMMKKEISNLNPPTWTGVHSLTSWKAVWLSVAEIILFDQSNVIINPSWSATDLCRILIFTLLSIMTFIYLTVLFSSITIGILRTPAA